MKLYLKQMLRSMLKNKVSTALLIMAIALSSAVFLSSQGMADQFVENFEKPYLENTEGHDLLIQASEPKDFFSLEGMDQRGLKKITPGIQALGIYEEDVQVKIYGQLEGDLPSESLKPREVILSHRMMKLYDLKVGDPISLTIYGKHENFVVGKTTLNQGVFYQDDENQFALKMNYEDIRKTLASPQGKYNYVLAQAEGDVSMAIGTFNKNNSDFKTDTLYDGNVIKQMISDQRGIFTMMLVIVVFMSSVIIYGTFKLMITKRLSVIGTFLSQGATRAKIFKILTIESLLYGVLGGIIGSGLGSFFLFLLQRLTAPLKKFDIYEPFNPNIKYMVMTLVFAVVLSVVSSILPILKTRKYPVKGLILNIQESEDNINHIKGFIGFLLILGVLVTMVMGESLSFKLAPLLILTAFIGVILFYPTGMTLILKPVIKLLKNPFGNLGLAFKHVLHISPLRGNITILIIVMTSVLLIVSLGMGLEGIVTEAYESLNTDLFIENIQVPDQKSKDEFMQGLKTYDFIKAESLQEEHMAFGKINGQSILVLGVEPKIYADFNRYINFKDSENLNLLKSLEDFNKKHTVLTFKAAKRLGLKVGDSLELTLNGFIDRYEITGLVDGRLYNNGDMIFLNGRHLEEGFNIYESQIYLSVNNNPEEAKQILDKYVKKYGGQVVTMENMKAVNLENNQSIVNILGAFSLVAVIIGTFGALNNMFIGYIGRKKTLAVLTSIGMSGSQVKRMLIKESLLCFIFAMAVVIPFSHLMMILVSNISYTIGLPLDLSFSLSEVLPYIIVSGFIYVLSTFPLIYTHKNFNVVKEIRS